MSSANINGMKEFMDKYRVSEPGCQYTHSAFGKPWGKYNIPDDKLDTFYGLYCNLLGRIDMHYTERSKKVGQLIIDVDFKFSAEHKERQYNQEDIKYIIGTMNVLIRKFYTISDNNMLKSFVSEKMSPSYVEKSDEYKDGIHIVYPYLPITMNMRKLLLDQLIAELLSSDKLNHIPHTNEMSDVIDTSIVRNNGWMLYGSKKHGGKYYKLSYVYDSDLNVINGNNYKSKQLVTILSNRKYNDSDELKPIIDSEDIVKDFKLGDSDDKVVKKDINSNDKPIVDKPIVDKPIVDKPIVNKTENKPFISVPFDDKIKDEVIKLLSMLSNRRADNYNDWIHIGWVLHNISETLLDEWKTFSMRVPSKYDPTECDHIWNHARQNSFTIGTLHYYAKKDNPIEYEEYTKSKN